MQAAGGMYSGFQTGRKQMIPGLPNGALDVNSLIAGMVDRTPWQFYDTLKLPPGGTVSNQYVMFQNAKGQQDQYNGSQVKSYVETNMQTGGQFNPPHDLLLQCIGFEVFADSNLYDIFQVFKFSYFELTIDEKVFFRAPLQFYPSGTGITGNSTQTGQSAYANGTPNPYATRRFDKFSRYIPPLMNFNVSVYFPETIAVATNTAAGATTNLTPAQVTNGQTAAALPILATQAQGGGGLWLKAILDGLTDRSVQ